MIYNKIEQLIKVADALVEGSLNELPKNLTNFKLVLESVKMALETEKVTTTPHLSATGKINVVNNDAIGVTKTHPIVKDEVPVPQPVKRKRRTKAEMLQAATEAAEALETKIDKAIVKVEESGERLDLPVKTVEAIKSSVSDSIKAKAADDNEQEAWEITLQDGLDDEVPWKEDEEKVEDVVETTIEDRIAELINKYPNPLNLSHLENRQEKVDLVTDMTEIRLLVGNKTTADIKECLSALNLDDDITIRAYKFLMVLPHLEIEIK